MQLQSHWLRKRLTLPPAPTGDRNVNYVATSQWSVARVTWSLDKVMWKTCVSLRCHCLFDCYDSDEKTLILSATRAPSPWTPPGCMSQTLSNLLWSKHSLKLLETANFPISNIFHTQATKETEQIFLHSACSRTWLLSLSAHYASVTSQSFCGPNDVTNTAPDQQPIPTQHQHTNTHTPVSSAKNTNLN